MSSNLRRDRRRPLLHAVATIAALCLTAGGCGLLDGAGFGKEVDGDCDSPKSGKTVDEPVACLDGRLETLPVPSDAQYNGIIKTIEGFGPKARIDPDTFAGAPIDVCVSLLRGESPAEIAPDAAEWFGYGDDRLTTAQAETIVELIKTQAWCAL